MRRDLINLAMVTYKSTINYSFTPIVCLLHRHHHPLPAAGIQRFNQSFRDIGVLRVLVSATQVVYSIIHDG